MIKNSKTSAINRPGGAGDILQRKCSCNSNKPGVDCEDCKKSTSARLQRKSENQNTTHPVPGIVSDVLRGTGSQMDTGTRLDMESKFGHDFSKVRIHDDSKAAQSAGALNASAYTFGNNIVFNRAQYNPGSLSGQQLLAHELTHVVQQSRSVPSFGNLRVAEPDSHFEKEAESAANVVGELNPAQAAAPASVIQRSVLSGLLDVLLFIPRLFGSETFPAEDLQAYLKEIKDKKGPSRSLFADNKARACVDREKEFGPYDKDTRLWLIQDMLDGYTSGADESAIIALLKRSPADLPQIVAAIGRDNLWSKFSGRNRRVIEAVTLTAADAGEALVTRLRNLPTEDIQDYAGNTTDTKVQEAVSRAMALSKIATPVPVGTSISATGQAEMVVNGVKLNFLPDKIDPGVGTHAFTGGNFTANTYVYPETPGDTTPVGQFTPVQITINIQSIFASENQKKMQSGYGVGTRPGDKENSLRFHEGAHGEAWIKFVTDKTPPVFPGSASMTVAQFNAAMVQFEKDVAAYIKTAGDYALKAVDCTGKLPTDAQLAGTGYDAAMCIP